MNQLNATFSFITSLLLNSSLINSVIDMNSLNGPITFDESSSALNQAIKSLENIKVDNILLSQFKSLLNDFNEQINVLNDEMDSHDANQMLNYIKWSSNIIQSFATKYQNK